MLSDKDRDTDELIKQIYEANKTLVEWAQPFANKQSEDYENERQQGILDIGKLTFDEDTQD